MIKTGGKQVINLETGDFDYIPVKYVDFHCSIEEWKRLSSAKSKFIYQLREKLFGNDYLEDSQKFIPGGHLDRTGHRDDYKGEEHSAKLITRIIKEVTNINDVNVIFRSWKGTVGYILISFPEHKETMPNIIIQRNIYGDSSNKIYIACLNAIYKILEIKELILTGKTCRKHYMFNRNHFNNKFDFYNYTGEYENYKDYSKMPQYGFHDAKERLYDEYDTIINYKINAALK